MAMTLEEGGMTVNTLAAHVLAGRTVDQRSIDRTVTGHAAKAVMGLTCRNKGCVDSAMAIYAVSDRRYRSGVHLDQVRVTEEVIIEFTTMAALAVCSFNLSNGDAGQFTIDGAVTGLAALSGMSLPSRRIGCRGRRLMATDTQSHSCHVVRMSMIIKFAAMTGLAGRTGRLANRSIDQETV